MLCKVNILGEIELLSLNYREIGKARLRTDLSGNMEVISNLVERDFKEWWWQTPVSS